MHQVKKYYDPDGNVHGVLPGTWNNISPFTEAVAIENGWDVEVHYVEDIEQPVQDDSKFRLVCEQFRGLCAQIGRFIGIEDFRGGFDEYATFINSPAAQQNMEVALMYAVQWSAMNELCKYEGMKNGLGQPDWWYRCWELANEGQNPQEESSEESIE